MPYPNSLCNILQVLLSSPPSSYTMAFHRITHQIKVYTGMHFIPSITRRVGLGDDLPNVINLNPTPTARKLKLNKPGNA